MSGAERLLPSPCVGICDLDERTGWCVGCGRSGEELFGWGDLTPERQRAVWAKLPERMAVLARPLRLLPWAGVALLDRLAALTVAPDTVWSIGIIGASAEFLGTESAPPAVAVSPTQLLARHPNGALVIDARAGLRGFVRDHKDGVEVILALHQSRVRAAVPSVLTELGPDTASATDGAHGDALFDLGFGAATARFCVRTAEAALVRALRAAAGRPTLDQAALLQRLAATSPHRVLLSPVGRIEVTSPIPPPTGASPAGPHTHLFPHRLKGPRTDDAVTALPDGYLACASVFATADAATAIALV